MATKGDTYQPSALTSLPLAIIMSIVFHGLLAFAAHSIWPNLFEMELKIPVQPLSVSLFTPKPPPTPAIEPTPEPLVEPPPPPPKPIAKPKSKPKPKPVKKKTKPKPVPPKRPTPALESPKLPPVKPQPVQQVSTQLTPKPTYRPEPKYPMIARRRGHQGVVILELTLSTSGSVSRALVVESSGHRSLDESALKTVKTWRFPANRFNGLSSFRQRIEFTLDR